MKTEKRSFVQIRTRSENEVSYNQHDPRKDYLNPLLLFTFEASLDREVIQLTLVGVTFGSYCG